MERVSLEELEADARAFDADVVATPDIDRFCSATDWILPAHEALMPPREPWVFRDSEAWVALARGYNRRGWRYLQALEAAWGLACPLLGRRVEHLAGCLGALLRNHEDVWDFVLLSGLPVKTPLAAAVVSALAPRYDLRLGSSTRRHQASLDGGVDGFLSRRSRTFRKNLRKAERRAADLGVRFVPAHAHTVAEADAAYARVLDVERRSWKGREGVGIDHGDMREFYRGMNHRMATRGAQRLWFAQHEGRDVAYVLGGLLANEYRGLQFSFDRDYAPYSLGSLAQLAQIRELCSEGVDLYDLGTEIAYKLRWGERIMESALLIITKR